MSDRSKFRVFDIDSGEYIEEAEIFYMTPSGECVVGVYDGDTEDIIYIPENKLIVEHCTGLTDSTKWDELSDKEKKYFYEEICNENKNVKYKSIEDVKHLWKGKLIFEGDIINDGWMGNTVILWSKEQSRFVLKKDNGGIAQRWSSNVKIVGNTNKDNWQYKRDV